MGDKSVIGVAQKSHQEERLSKKHIQTLGYVQELVNENKKLRQIIEEYDQQKLHCDDLHAQNEAAQEKIKLIQQQSMAKADEINAMLVRKHEQEQIKLKEEKLDAERKLETQTREMALEIERLQKLNTSLEEALKAKATMASNQSELKEQNEVYRQQILNLQAQIATLSESNDNRLKEIKKLEQALSQQRSLKEQLGSSNQMIKELQGRIKQLETDLSDANSTLAGLQDNEMKSYKSKLIKALGEVSNLQHSLHVKDSEIEKLKQSVAELMDEIEVTQTLRFSLEREVEMLKREIVELKKQIARLKGKSDESGTFKEFVAVKRELMVLQEEHNRLRERMLSNTGSRATSSKSTSKQKINLKLR